MTTKIKMAGKIPIMHAHWQWPALTMNSGPRRVTLPYWREKWSLSVVQGDGGGPGGKPCTAREIEVFIQGRVKRKGRGHGPITEVNSFANSIGISHDGGHNVGTDSPVRISLVCYLSRLAPKLQC